MRVLLIGALIFGALAGCSTPTPEPPHEDARSSTEQKYGILGELLDPRAEEESGPPPFDTLTREEYEQMLRALEELDRRDRERGCWYIITLYTCEI